MELEYGISVEEYEDNQDELFQNQIVSLFDDIKAKGNSSTLTKYFNGKNVTNG